MIYINAGYLGGHQLIEIISDFINPYDFISVSIFRNKLFYHQFLILLRAKGIETSFYRATTTNTGTIQIH